MVVLVGCHGDVLGPVFASPQYLATGVAAFCILVGVTLTVARLPRRATAPCPAAFCGNRALKSTDNAVADVAADATLDAVKRADGNRREW
jgi:hypothetical protein